MHLLSDALHGHVIELQHQTLFPFCVVHLALEVVHVTTQLAGSLVALRQVCEEGGWQGRGIEGGFSHLIY